jgi:KUP system potassium uptake protein
MDPVAPRKRTGVRDLTHLSLVALGVVYGDIGTSPLYAMKACFAHSRGVAVTPANVLGIVSLFFWSLVLVVVLKYIAFVMRADNRGEGGVLALVALLVPGLGDARSKKLAAYVVLGLFGAALFYCQGIITPAVSVLGAVEGLAFTGEVFSKPVIILITIAVLVALFAFQKRGTAHVGAVFGPAMLVWFATLAILGVRWIAKHPSIVAAVDPRHAVAFLASHGTTGFIVLGAVALCVTGGEALYTDMGHFGKKPICTAWFFVAFPALVLVYFGQGALLLDALERGAVASVVDNPFFAMVDGWLRYPLVALATMAAIIASQAFISGAFSLTQSAVQLGYSPRVTIKHTSNAAYGQIFVPEINAALMVGAIVIVLLFGESAKLASAYGIVVTATMTITSVLFYGVARRHWGWSRWTAGALAFAFLTVDLPFLAASLRKLGDEGTWILLALAVVVFVLMRTWKRGRARLEESMGRAAQPLSAYLDLGQKHPHRIGGRLRIPGTAVFLTSSIDAEPHALVHYLAHNMLLHERVLLLATQTRHVPHVPPSERVAEVETLGLGVFRVVAHYGFMETPNVPEVLALSRGKGLEIDPSEASFFLGRETLVLTQAPGMARWQKELFAYMSRNARPATAFFQIPPKRVVEFGSHVEL